MDVIRVVMRWIADAVFFVCAWLLIFIFSGVIWSFFYDGGESAVGYAYGFWMLTVPLLVSRYVTSKFARKLKEKQLAKGDGGEPPETYEPEQEEASESEVCEPAMPLPQKLPAYTAPVKPVASTLRLIDAMEGHDFEYWCAGLLRRSGYTSVEVTPKSGDHGVDIIAERHCVRYAIQCKRYRSSVSNKPVQEIYAGKVVYGCKYGAVLTNQYFTDGAKQLAAATGTLLWDRDWIKARLKEEQPKKQEKKKPLKTDDLMAFIHSAQYHAAASDREEGENVYEKETQ